MTAIAGDGKKRQEQASQKMNNIRSANVVILKQPTIEEIKDNLDNQSTYPITTATQSQKLAISQAPK